MDTKIKYGDITIIHNEEELNILTSLKVWLGYERITTKNSKILILFEDGEVFAAEDKLKDFEYKFFTSFSTPLYFKKNKRDSNNDNYIYFYKNPTLKDNLYKLDFKPLFNSYTKFNSSMNVASYYNRIYFLNKYSGETEIFGILRIKSSENMPRFQFAYDSDEFTRDEIVYLIHYMFTL